MRRGRRQIQLDNYVLKILSNSPSAKMRNWCSLDLIDDWAVDWCEEEGADFTEWLDHFNGRARFMAIFDSLERLVALGHVKFRRDRRANIQSQLQYKAVDVLESLAAIPTKRRRK